MTEDEVRERKRICLEGDRCGLHFCSLEILSCLGLLRTK